MTYFYTREYEEYDYIALTLVHDYVSVIPK